MPDSFCCVLFLLKFARHVLLSPEGVKVEVSSLHRAARKSQLNLSPGRIEAV